MIRPILTAATLTLLLAGASASGAATPPTEPAPKPKAPAAEAALAPGREIAGMFFRRELSGLWERFSEEFQREMSAEALGALRQQVENDLGAEQGVVDERVSREGNYDVYRRVARYTKYSGSIEMLVATRKDGKIAGFVVRDPRAVPKR